MKIKRIVAKDSRSALALIKQTLGEDAVILSSNKIGKDVEIMAAIDTIEKPSPNAMPTGSAFASKISESVEQISRLSKVQNPATRHASEVSQQAHQFATEFTQDVEKKIIKLPEQQLQKQTDQMQKEIQGLRLLLENHLLREPSNRPPLHRTEEMEVNHRLQAMGLTESLIDRLLDDMDMVEGTEVLWGQACDWMAQKLVVPTGRIPDVPGIYALVGSTGVGKTSVISKLAAQLALSHGKHSVAIISMDQNRIGARDQLRIFGTMLGVEVYHLATLTELGRQLEQLKHKPYVLIDTHGGGAFDDSLYRFVESLEALSTPIATYLTISANSQTDGISHQMHQLKSITAGVVITKLDEGVPLGGLLTALIESEQPVAIVTDGPRIPLDLSYPSAVDMVNQAISISLPDLTDQALAKRHLFNPVAAEQPLSKPANMILSRPSKEVTSIPLIDEISGCGQSYRSNFNG